MFGKLKWFILAVLLLGLTSGCRLCERWYEREHDPHYNRPYYTPAGGAGCYCPPVNQPTCPPGCTPVGGYGAGFAPAPACPPGCAPYPG